MSSCGVQFRCGGRHNSRARVPDVRLALMLARYDRTLAEAFLAAHGKQLPANMSSADESEMVLATIAILDPKQAASMVDRLPDGAAKSDAGQRLARFLTCDDAKFWNLIQSRYLMLWIVDQEDFGDAD